jgi:dihydroorotate dehydrogenase electron transfer subunit
VEAVGKIAELIWIDAQPAARITCARRLIPGPGKYLLALAKDSEGPLASIVFAAKLLSDGLVAAPPLPGGWNPGIQLALRGPLGRGFDLPPAARRIALVACDNDPSRLAALLDPAFKQGASVTLVCDNPPQDLPLEVELQTSAAMAEVCRWADYAAFDVERESLPGLLGAFPAAQFRALAGAAQVLVRTPMPCGALAKCGVCTVRTSKGEKLACEDGPVFDFGRLLLER